ncbi:SusC/RagA family TonB-linked outer membrane protein [Flammeovirga kamogawensis]|uniref:TonB-dependent receptor n=1 Tax=Flammeovirga kamogawensis TaxID=373891 RepID=A0ABX8GU65_9BACT|nr:TonB-dependent receptor [Flammeovirga kamogawensis]MBB6460047.1 TonB-linked SusC/RagA family outer membrane protein [Flammeovirga kamogawensis]QWG06906.1 TonB-dependent receptor [Flammeovirga kamogawensis]TRX68727.1 TonB-dependent receptor [Flammeovirga kamogawensis]
MKKRIFAFLFLFLAALAYDVSAQDKKEVSGVVKDGSEPLPGVTVLVKGTTYGSITDFDGKYKLKVSPSDVIIYRFIGFKTQEVPVGNQSTINVGLEADAEELEEVTVMGYAKTDVSSNSAKVENVTDVVTPSVTSSLQGKAAGVNISSNSGQPGAKQNIVIRGQGSISNTASDPLYVIDGIIQDGEDINYNSSQSEAERDPLSMINPEDIESVEVLKDAAATALYGARAANGVIVVTTKRGKSGKPQITFNTRQGISVVNKGNWSAMNADQFVDSQAQALANKNGGKPEDYYSQIPGVTVDSKGNPIYSNTDWSEHAFRQARISSYDLTMSGGNEDTKYYASAGYMNNEGILVGSNFERYSLRLNLDQKINKRLTANISTNLSYTDQQDASGGGGYSSPLLATYMQLPTLSPYDSNGELLPRIKDGSTDANFLYDIEKGNKVVIGQVSTQLVGSLKYQIADWLSFKQTGSVNYQNAQRENYRSPLSFDGAAYNGYKEDKITSNSNILGNSIFNFSKTFGNAHNVDAIAGFEYQVNNKKRSYSYGENIPVGLENLDNSAANKDASGFKESYKYMSYLGQLSYNYDGKYYATFSARRDGSSKFARNKKWGTFWSTSASWYLSREDFLADNNVITLAKLRGSYGTTGNANIGNFDARGLYSYYGYQSKSAGTYRQIENPDLSWEVRKKLGVGFDISLVDRVTLNVDYYRERSESILLNRPLSSSSGFTSGKQNLGIILNKGWEFALTTTNILKTNFTWSTSFNIGINKNEIQKLDGQDIISGVRISRVGSAVNTFYLREWAGADPKSGNGSWYANDGKDHAGESGYYKRNNRWATSDYNKAERIESGQAGPKITGGLTNNFKYKNWDLSIFLTFSQGGKIWRNSNVYTDNDGYSKNRNQEGYSYSVNRWKKDGDVADYAKWGAYGASKNSDRQLEDGSYVSLRNITLGYNFPSTWVKTLRLGSVRLYGSAQNLFTLTSYSGMTPITAPIHGINFFEYPEGRVFTGGLSVKF